MRQEQSPVGADPEPDLKGGPGWFQGSPEDAFKAATKTGKPMLLYWGARWCPPCNELKSNVFSKREFQELLGSVVAVYLDGDSEEAQVWGDKLKASGYPTLLFLSPAGKEITRFSTGLTISEFREAFNSTLQASQPLSELIARIGRQADAKAPVTDNEWRQLAYTFAAGDPGSSGGLEALRERIRVKSGFPERLRKEKAMFAARVIESVVALDSGDPAQSAFKSQQADWMAIDIQGLLSDPIGRDGARSLICYQTEEVLGLLQAHLPAADFLRIKGQWLAAADWIALQEGYSVDTRLWAAFPYIGVEKISRKDGATPASATDAKPATTVYSAATVEKIKQAARMADREAKTSYERQAVISGAGYLLQQVGAWEEARKLLEAEAGRSQTPYYYYSSLASLEQKAGKVEAAKAWSAKAKAGADGRATKLQWITSDFLLLAKLNAAEGELAPIIDEYYTVALALADGFKGRNATRAKKMQDEIAKRLPASSSIAAVVNKHHRVCVALPQGQAQDCRAHFSGVDPRLN